LLGNPEAGTATISVGKSGPCIGKSVNGLDYNTLNEYGKGNNTVTETAKDHIMRNHIDPAPNKSQYRTDPPQGRDAMFLQVQFYNRITFLLGPQLTQFNKRGQIVAIIFAFTFPRVPIHPIYGKSGQNWIGVTRSGSTTLLNTLTLKPDCQTVTNSFPGPPF